MLLSECILRNNYTIFINKEKRSNELQGVYFKNINNGVCQYQIPQKEIMLMNRLSEIMELLDDGALLQLKMDRGLIHAVIGNQKIDGRYHEKEYLEVIGEIKSLNYYEILIDLNMSLADNRRREIKERKNGVQTVKEYKKLYKGASSYE